MGCMGAERSRTRLGTLLGKLYMALKVELANTVYEGDRRKGFARGTGSYVKLVDLHRLEVP